MPGSTHPTHPPHPTLFASPQCGNKCSNGVCRRGRCQSCPRGTQECNGACQPDRFFSTNEHVSPAGVPGRLLLAAC